MHNEEVRDLLHPDTATKAISIRERADGAIVVSGIKAGGLLRTSTRPALNILLLIRASI